MESIDDLLSQLKSEYDEKSQPTQPKKTQSVKGEQVRQSPIVPVPQTSGQMSQDFADFTENSLVAEIKAEFAEKEREDQIRKQQQLKPKDAEKNQPDQQKKQQPVKGEQVRQISIGQTSQTYLQRTQNFTPFSADKSLLGEIQAEFAEKEREEELRRQQQIKEEQIRQEKIKQQQRQALRKEAEAWLKKLNPRSEEGLWFEEFAYSYPSKLEAAIDYLQALRETQS